MAIEKVVTFDSAPEAFQWAEEILSRSQVDTQMARMRRVRGFGEFTPDELRDQALTISIVVARAQPFEGAQAFQFVYGRGEDLVVQNLVDLLLRRVIERVKTAKGKHGPKVTCVVHDTVQSYRRYVNVGKPQNISRLAQEVGVTRQTFSNGGWMYIVKEVREALDDWLRIANQNIETELEGKGFVV